MKFSFLTYQFARYPLEYCFKMAKEYGFEGVEVWGARPHAYAFDMDHDAIRDILSWKKKYGVEVSMLTPELLAYPYNLVSASVKEQKESVEYLKRNLENAAAMGTDKMQIAVKHPGYGRDKEEVWNISVPNIAIPLWTHIPTFAASMSFFHCMADVVQYRILIPQTL